MAAKKVVVMVDMMVVPKVVRMAVRKVVK